MDSKSAFCSACKVRNVLSPEGKTVHDDIEKFKAFRSLVDPEQVSSYDRLVMHWGAAENAAPGAGNLLSMLLEQGQLISSDPITVDMEKVRELLSSDPERDIVVSCYDLIGTEGLIEVTKGHREARSDRLDVQDSYKFELTAAIDVRGTVTRNLASAVIIDGFIEEVSEIHHLLQKVSESKAALFMFARGFSSDVLNTLSVNLARRTLDVYPFSVPLELGHVNDMYDLALISGCEVISSDKGQLISMIKQDRLANLQFVKYVNSERALMLRNEMTRDAVATHVTALKRRAEESNSANLPEIMGRIRKLTSLTCVVSLRPDSRFEERHASLRRTCREMDHVLRYGIVQLRSGEKIPGSSLAIARKHHADIKDQLRDTVTLSAEMSSSRGNRRSV